MCADDAGVDGASGGALQVLHDAVDGGTVGIGIEVLVLVV